MYGAKFSHELRAVISLLDYLMVMMMMIIIIIIIEWHHDSSWVLEYSQEIICLKRKGS